MICACQSANKSKNGTNTNGVVGGAGNAASAPPLPAEDTATPSQTGAGGRASVPVSTGGAGNRPSAPATSGSAGNAPSSAGSPASGSAGSTPAGASGHPSAGNGSATPPAAGCGMNMLPLPDDPGMRGPWDVGVRTVQVGRLTIELMYPALPGSTAGKPEVTYDLRDWLPAEDRDKVPADHSPPVGALGGHLYRDVPIDEGHGPYPVVIFIHGTASFRIASLSTNVHWASRGLVVLAADYPGLGLADQLNDACGRPLSGDQDIEGDVNAQIEALNAPSSDLAFLAGHVDMTRLGISGHSQGACMSATLSTIANMQIVLPLAGSTQVSPSDSLKSIMWIAGMEDTVIGYDSAEIGNIVCPANPLPATSDIDGYNNSPGSPDVTKRIMGIAGGGHLAPTDLCQTNMQGNTAIQEAENYGVCGVDSAVIIGLPALFDCGSPGFDWKQGIAAVNYASAAALEETLFCRDRSAAFDNLRMNLPQVGDFQHDP